MFIMVSILLPTTEAEIFKIGNKVSETDPTAYGNKFYYYDSDCILDSYDNYESSAIKIFDGNTSTGVAKFFGYHFNQITFSILFTSPLFINNITVKPNFGGDASIYYFVVIFHGNGLSLADDTDKEKTFKINGFIDEIQLNVYEKTVELSNVSKNYTGYMYFNDVIIEYRPPSDPLEDLQSQINVLSTNINTIENDILMIKKDISNIKSNITLIEDTMPLEYNDSALKGQIKNLTEELNSLKENLNEINKSIPKRYNDSVIKSNIFNIEAENIFLQQKIGNLTIRIENLTTKLEKLSSDVQNLQSSGVNEPSNNKQESTIYKSTDYIIFGIIIIILLLIILKLSISTLKRKHPDIEKPRPDDLLISKIKYDILTNKEIKDSRLYDDEYKKLLENGYRKGEMSPETYNYIKTVLEVPKKPQNFKKIKEHKSVGGKH
jgi:hypothetical protein